MFPNTAVVAYFWSQLVLSVAFRLSSSHSVCDTSGFSCLQQSHIARTGGNMEWARRGRFTRIYGSSSNHDVGSAVNPAITPLANNVMVRVHEVTSKTAGGIILPDAAKKRPTEGVVTAVGPGQTNYDTGYTRPVSVAAGDSVVYGRYDGVEFKINGTSHQIIKDMDVLLKYRGGSSATLENVVCIHDRVLVRSTRAKEPTATAAGIYVAPSSSQSDSSASEEGEVVKVGPGFLTDHGKLIEVTVKPGEHVRFRKYAAEEVQLDGQDYFVVRASDLLAKW